MINAKTNENQIYDALCNFKFFASLSVVSWVEKPKNRINMLWNIFSHESFHDGYRECSKYKMECIKKRKKRRTKQRDREKTHATTNKRTNEQNAVRTSLCWKRFSHNLVIALRWILYWLLVLSVYIIAVSLNRFEQPYVTYIVFALRKKWQYERKTFLFSQLSYELCECVVYIFQYISALFRNYHLKWKLFPSKWQ